jgi:outer membrane protein OmpA-like peptidoglycan-associated protein
VTRRSDSGIGHDPTLPATKDQFPKYATARSAVAEEPRKIGPLVVAGALFVLLLGGFSWWVHASVHGAAARIAHPDSTSGAPEPQVAVADNSEVGYCTPAFKTVLQRVLNSCGLVGSESRRGCQPADVKTFASISDEDFNALFTPLKDRGAVILFDEGKDDLDDGAKKLLEERWQDRRGARYFFVVARASKTGTPDANRALSHRRANSVMLDLQDVFHDPDLDKQVGLLWLGNEFAQLSKDYCDWPTSRETQAPKEKCSAEMVNRSAFVSWVDCRL